MRRGLAAAVGLTLGMAVALWPHSASREKGKEEDIVLSHGTDVDAGAIARPMPDKPVRGQKTPPCSNPPEVEIRGGCWIEIAQRPPCPKRTAEYESKCYIGVGSEKQEPVSIVTLT